MAEAHKKDLIISSWGMIWRIAIAHILKECKDCKEDHVENCIINVIRNCYEIGLFGDIQPYEGSSLQYMMRLKSDFPEKSQEIAEQYMN